MIQKRQLALAAFVLVATSAVAFAQGNPKAQERRAQIEAAVSAIGLDQGQVAKIREIRQGRPAEGADQAARRAFNQERRGKLMAILNADQKAKLEEIQKAGPDSKAFEGAVLLGLAQRARGQRARGQRQGGQRQGGQGGN